MPALTVRQLEDDVYQGLKAQADSRGRSLEAEVCSILVAAVHGRRWWEQWVEATESLRGDALPVLPRSSPQAIDRP